MKEILLTSSVLILMIFLVRSVFQKAISRRVQYALWALVLVRLLIPFQFPAMEHNVLTAAAPVQQVIFENLETQTVFLPVDRAPLQEHPTAPDMVPEIAMSSGEREVWVVETDETAVQYRKLTGEEVLCWVWLAGMVVMATSFLCANLSFYRKLRKARTPYSIDDCRYSVYFIEEGLPSPCLFGLIRPAIYLTPAAVRNEETLRHVLAHETTHARHLDPLWALLRGVCLVVYWFNPLVWAAAYASRTDCELACDEGALKLLGESERISYGKTLLSLIPVRKHSSSPLLSATTMTAEKKKQTDRIKRIAENRQTVHAALFAVIALAVMICALTFTGAKTEKSEVVPLTFEEITWFNTEFFNGEPINVRNQFLSSTYERPEDIDMYELFYTGGGVFEAIPPGEEKTELLETYYGGTEPDCFGMKLQSGKIDAVLLHHTGLSLADTQALGMGGFQYLAKYDAYYLYHGDTNYRSQVVIASGEREGDIVRLYYYDAFMDGTWKCVTLQYRDEVGSYEATFDPSSGKKRVTLIDTAPGYHFVSNLPCDAPAGSSAAQVILPAGEAEKTVKLDRITDVGPVDISAPEADGAAVRRALGSAESIQVASGPYTVVCWQNETTGNIHFSYGRTNGNIGEATFYDILVGPPPSYGWDGYDLQPFYNLLGHSGFMISYPADKDLQPSSSWNYTVHQYYDIKDGQLQLLATTVGGWDQRTDLDSDGIPELFFDTSYIRHIDNIYPLLFYRDGTIWGVDIQKIVDEAYPNWEYMRTGTYNDSCIPVTGSYQREDGVYVEAFRSLYFTGEEMLFYKDNRDTVDHIVGTPDVSPEILTFAKDMVSSYYADAILEEWHRDAAFDDWRIEKLVHDKTYNFNGGDIEVYNMNFEFHAGNPAGVMLAGGMYHNEDDWVMPSYPNCFYLYVLNQNGQRRLLDMQMINDCSPGLEMFDNDVYNMAMDEGLTTLTELEGKALLQRLAINTVDLLEEMTHMTPEEQKKVAEKICYYRTSGPEEDQELYQYTMQALVQWNTYEFTTAQYDAWSLLFNYHVCQPADLTDEERYAALEAAERYMRKMGESEYCLSFDLKDVSIDSYETWRIVNMYTDSELAVSQGYDHETMTHLTALRAVYDVSWDHTKTANDEEGRSARYLYMLPDKNGEWFVWDQIGCAAPELYELVIDALADSPTVALMMNDRGYLTEMDNYWRIRIEDYPTDFVWNSKVKLDEIPSGNALTLADEEFGISIKCWEDLDLVCVTLYDETAWYTAAPINTYAGFDGSLFSMIRQWYDDVEWQSLVDGIVIEDRGQSHLEIANEWAERYAQAFLQVTSGSQYACTYARTDAELWDWVPETAYPAITEGAERFYFGFDRIFVPETEHAYYYQMAGNTEDYDGSLGEAPEGACIDSRVGPMYKTEDGWRCVGVGTGI